MNYLLLPLNAILLYMICTLLLSMKLRQDAMVAGINKVYLLIPGFLGIMFHLLTLQGNMLSSVGINLGFYSALSLVGAFIVLFTLISIIRHDVEIMGCAVMPISSIAVILDSFNLSVHWVAPGDSNELVFHIISSLVAYSLLALAALHAIVLSIQNRFLHDHQPGGVVKLLPPLKTMESLLFDTIVIGFICLSVSLASGLIFLENMFAQHLAHKTILSITAWFVFGILLVGRWSFGWRGKTAIRWTLSGFASLMLAYFGSKFVLEIILA